MFSSADMARRLMLIAKRDKWQFVVKTWRYVRSVAAAHSLCWLARYLKSSVSFWTRLVLQCRVHARHQLSKHTQEPLHEKPYVLSTTFGRATLGANGVANTLFIAFLHSDPHVGVMSPPETGKICDITYYIATNPLLRGRRSSHETQANITTKEWLFFILFCSHSFW